MLQLQHTHTNAEIKGIIVFPYTIYVHLDSVCWLHNSYCSEARPISNEANTRFIKSSCGVTAYPDLYFTTLSCYAAKIQANPKLLASTALSVTIKATRSTSAVMKKLSNSHGLTTREAAAVYDCVEELSDSIDELQMSIREMGRNGGKNLALQMNNIQTWVSAAMTDEDTCMDGFSGNSMNWNHVKITVKAKC